MRWLEDQDTPWNAFQTALDAESLGRVGSWLNLVGNWPWPRRCDKVKHHAVGYRGPKADPAPPTPCAVAEKGDNGRGRPPGSGSEVHRRRHPDPLNERDRGAVESRNA